VPASNPAPAAFWLTNTSIFGEDVEMIMRIRSATASRISNGKRQRATRPDDRER